MVSGHAEVAGFRAGLRGEEFCTVCEPHEIDDIKPLLTCKSRNFDLKVKERVMVGIFFNISFNIFHISCYRDSIGCVEPGVWASPIETLHQQLGKDNHLPAGPGLQETQGHFICPSGRWQREPGLCGCLLVNAEVPQTQSTLGCDRSIPQRTYRCDLKHGQVHVVCPSDKS